MKPQRNKRNKRSKQNNATIDESKSVALLPGMLMSAKVLIEFGDSEWRKGDPKGLYPGAMTAAIIISAQCAELLLKYKIEREGHPIKQTHDLFNLYETLEAESKAAIQKEFNKHRTITLPNGWDSAESVFQKARHALVNWRYAVEPTDQSLIYPHALYIAAVSIYKTTPIQGSGITRKEVTDPSVKASVFRGITK